MPANGNYNDNYNANDTIFTFKDTKLYAFVVTLSARDYQKLSRIISKGSEWSIYWNEDKTISENKNTKNEYRYFLESNFLEVNTLFVLVYSNQDANSKRFRTLRYYLPKVIIDNYNVITNEKNHAIDSDIKRYEEIRKLTTGKDYNTGRLLDHDYIRNNYKLIAAEADPKAFQQIEFVGQLKSPDNEINANESMFILTILEKIKEKRLKYSQGSITVLLIIANYQEAKS